MENRINVAELLKDCPKGMALDCTMFDNVKFIRIEKSDRPICIRTGNTYHYLTIFGTWTFDENAKCVIFPKGKTTWEGLVPPCKFNDGDIVTDIEGAVIIYKGITTCGYCGSYVSLDHYNQFIPHYKSYLTDTIRFSTDDEKAKLFQAITDYGYKWNAETKILVRLIEPKFKVGDRIKSSFNNNEYIIKNVTDTHYTIVHVESKCKFTEPFCEDVNWELVPDKFDINTLIPFESKVLVRNTDKEIWKPAIFGCCPNKKPSTFFALGGCIWRCCIPYNGNEHLLGTTKDCEDRYKLWLS